MLRDTGEMPIESADDANVPMVCFLSEPDREHGFWTWQAINFMPRKERCGGGYLLEADTKEEIMEALRKHVIPLYEAAAANMRENGANYYWKHEAPNAKASGAGTASAAPSSSAASTQKEC